MEAIRESSDHMQMFYKLKDLAGEPVKGARYDEPPPEPDPEEEAI